MSSFRAVLLIAGVTTMAAAADTRVRVVAAPGAERCLSGLVVTAQSVEGGVVSRTELPSDTETLALPFNGKGQFSVRAHATGCWSESVEKGDAGTELVLHVFKAV